MKKLFSLFAALAVVCTLSAQTQIATLSSGDSIKTFYGHEALLKAYSASTHGDVITLSEGNFEVPAEINKRITIRGAGMNLVTLSDSTVQLPTILDGHSSFKVYTKAVGHEVFTLEGVCYNGTLGLGGTNPQLIKCKLKEVSYCYVDGRTDTLRNGSFVNCHVYSGFSIQNADVLCQNSYIQEYHSYNRNMSCRMDHCVVTFRHGGDYIENTYLTNCILKFLDTNSAHTSNPMIYNCLWVGYVITSANYPNAPFDSCDPAQNNHVFPQDSTLFVDGSFCELTPAAKAYKGNDGTELGIYGGMMPFSPTPSVPQITKFAVAPKTDAEGKLAVDIEISQP